MPTKPDPVNDLPPLWGGAGNYLPGVYTPSLPWGLANPLAGQPFPWGGQPRLNTTALTAFANTGHTPQVPDDASSMNEWLRRAGIWSTNWVALGTNAPDADAHIMETDAFGFSSAVKYIGQFEGPGSTPADLPLGFDVPAGETSSFGDGCTVTAGATFVFTMGANSTVTGDTTTTSTHGTFDTIDNTGSVKVGRLIPYEGSPGFTRGSTIWDGRAWAVGNGLGAAPRLARPVLSYVTGPVTTAAAILDSGASVTIDMLDTQKAKIVATAQIRSDAVGNNIRFRVDTVAGTIGNNNTIYEPIAALGVSQTVTRIIIYTATSDAAVTFRARLGANAGNTTVDDVSIEASHI